MDALLFDSFFLIAAFLSVAAAVAFLIFLAGFLPGASHLITLSGHAEHLTHYRTRALWGTTLLIFIFFVWEAIRWIAGLF